MLKNFLWMLPVIACNVTANILLKLGANAPPSKHLLGLCSLQTLLGLFFFGFAGLVYAFVLRFIPLTFAQVLSIAQYIFTIFLAILLLGETVTTMQSFGIVLVLFGLFFITL